MHYRTLGSTGLKVSEIGFGCWGIGGAAPGTKSYGPTEDAVSIAALHRALELGVTFYDTADLYGRGHSEEILAEAFAGKRDKIVIASKAGISFDAEERQFKNLEPDHLRESLEGSLRRLRTDYIDLYQLHDPSMDALKADPRPVELLKQFQAEGKILAWGISAASPNDGLIAAEVFGAPCLQVNFNLIDQRAIENGLTALAEKRNIGIIGRTPLCFGFLTGRYNADTKFDPADHRAGWPREQIALWAKAPEIFQQAIQAPAGQTPGQVAIRYCLSYPVVSTNIPGMLRAAEVDENIAAASLGPLTAVQCSAAEAAYRQHVFFVPRKPKA